MGQVSQALAHDRAAYGLTVPVNFPQAGTNHEWVVIRPVRLPAGPSRSPVSEGATRLHELWKRVHRSRFVHELLQVDDLRQQLAVGVLARCGEVGKLTRRLVEGRKVWEFELGRVIGEHVRRHPVPVLTQQPEELTDVGELDAGGHAEDQRFRDIIIVEQLLLHPRPALLECDGRSHLIEHLDSRWQPRLDRVRREDALGEGVQGADGGEVELVQRSSCARSVRLLRAGLLEGHAEAVAQLGGRLRRERHGGDGRDRDTVTQDQRDDTLDQGSGLPGARSGADE